MIWSYSWRQLAIASGLIFVLGTVNLHAEQKPDIEAVAAANLAFDTAISGSDIHARSRRSILRRAWGGLSELRVFKGSPRMGMP
jgi:hypothetical protein